jgi:hypothetical protein
MVDYRFVDPDGMIGQTTFAYGVRITGILVPDAFATAVGGRPEDLGWLVGEG